MARDAALRGVFMSLVAFLCGMMRDRVRPDCHQSGHQNHSGEAGLHREGRNWWLC
jgi:hypothetical protein